MNHGACRDESNVRACFRPARRAILAAPSALCAPSYDDALTVIDPAMWIGLDQNIILSEKDYETIMWKKGSLCRLWQSDHVTSGNLYCDVGWIASANYCIGLYSEIGVKNHVLIVCYTNGHGKEAQTECFLCLHVSWWVGFPCFLLFFIAAETKSFI